MSQSPPNVASDLSPPRPADRPEPIAAPGTLAWLGQTIVTLAWTVLTARGTIYVYIALYFLATQNGAVKPLWNTLLDPLLGTAMWAIIRHFLRAGMESLLASATAWVMVANPYKLYDPQPPKSRFGRIMRAVFTPAWLLTLMERLGIPTARTYGPDTQLKWWQWLLLPPAFVFSGLPGIALGVGIYFLVSGIRHPTGESLPVDLSGWPDLIQELVALSTENWQYVLAGILGTLFYARLVSTVYAAELMELVANQMAGMCHHAQSKGHGFRAWLLAAHKFHPVGYRAAFLSAYRNPRPPSKLAPVMLALVAVVLLITIPFGYVVITYVATHQMKIPGFG